MQPSTDTQATPATMSLSQKLTAGVVTKTAPVVAAGLVIGGIGSYLGAGITNVWAQLALFLVFFLGIFFVQGLVRKSRNAGLAAWGVWNLVAGLFIGPAIHQHIQWIGWEAVLQCYVGTAAVMMGCWATAMLSRYNFEKWGPFLFTALWGLIIVGLLRIFVVFGGWTNAAYSLIGMAVFVGYFLFDFNRAKKLDNTWPNALDVGMGLVLNFYNFLLFFLNFRSGDRR